MGRGGDGRWARLECRNEREPLRGAARTASAPHAWRGTESLCLAHDDWSAGGELRRRGGGGVSGALGGLDAGISSVDGGCQRGGCGARCRADRAQAACVVLRSDRRMTNENPYESPREVSKPLRITDPLPRNAAAFYALSCVSGIGSILALLMAIGMPPLPQFVRSAFLAVGAAVSFWAARYLRRASLDDRSDETAPLRPLPPSDV